jgi:hypothetical protein
LLKLARMGQAPDGKWDEKVKRALDRICRRTVLDRQPFVLGHLVLADRSCGRDSLGGAGVSGLPRNTDRPKGASPAARGGTHVRFVESTVTDRVTTLVLFDRVLKN